MKTDGKHSFRSLLNQESGSDRTCFLHACRMTRCDIGFSRRPWNRNERNSENTGVSWRDRLGLGAACFDCARWLRKKTKRKNIHETRVVAVCLLQNSHALSVNRVHVLGSVLSLFTSGSGKRTRPTSDGPVQSNILHMCSLEILFTLAKARTVASEWGGWCFIAFSCYCAPRTQRKSAKSSGSKEPASGVCMVVASPTEKFEILFFST
jgi:hypothetical protein